MTRRITIPEDHVALILPAQLADELQSLTTNLRLRLQIKAQRARRAASAHPDHVEECKAMLKAGDEEALGQYDIAGDVLLALLEAKEA